MKCLKVTDMASSKLSLCTKNLVWTQCDSVSLVLIPKLTFWILSPSPSKPEFEFSKFPFYLNRNNQYIYNRKKVGKMNRKLSGNTVFVLEFDLNPLSIVLKMGTCTSKQKSTFFICKICLESSTENFKLSKCKCTFCLEVRISKKIYISKKYIFF